MTEEETTLRRAAVGRLFRMMSRPTQPGDVATYETLRALLMRDAELWHDTRPNWAAQRLQGAQGD